ncbi:hypothetical protein [Bacteriovorax sp. Seq25_V]|uniref:hypothetical protein n=1 Tax=Bacteriovorax sp. Seq25_V TaxID=1201288 RepID=UPI00038A3ACB|nr:hypothetical protein [Bacteriovorax sp. Seq25_V]EQC47490.1 hypothetical protein M900_0871 [Bacteriovorax sp. Seq25_V]
MEKIKLMKVRTVIKSFIYTLYPEKYFEDFESAGFIKYLMPFIVLLSYISAFMWGAEFLNIPVNSNGVFSTYFKNLILLTFCYPVSFLLLYNFTSIRGYIRIFFVSIYFQAMFYSLYSFFGGASFLLISENYLYVFQSISMPLLTMAYLGYVIFRISRKYEVEINSIKILIFVVLFSLLLFLINSFIIVPLNNFFLV